MNIRSLITFLHGRFVHIHTFFHYKMMCGCRLRTCLYYIRQTSYERRLHRSHVSPPVPIWAEFISTIGTRYAMGDLSHHACPEPRRAAAIICRHILLGENLHNLIRTRAHEKKSGRFFSRPAIICTVYCWEKCKNCKVRLCLCPLDPSIFHFIWIKHGGKIWQLELSNRICKKMKMVWKVGICTDCTM